VANTAKYLTHLCQYVPTVLDHFTDPTSPTSLTTIGCFAYFGEATRQQGGQLPTQFEQRVGWFVILPNAMFGIKVGQHINSIVDNQGLPVRKDGRVEEVVVYRHHRKGVQFVQVRLNEN